VLWAHLSLGRSHFVGAATQTSFLDALQRYLGEQGSLERRCQIAINLHTGGFGTQLAQKSCNIVCKRNSVLQTLYTTARHYGLSPNETSTTFYFLN